MNVEKSDLCQHVATYGHFISWDDAYILNMEPHYTKRRIDESFLINKLAKAVNNSNSNEGVVLPSI